MIGKSYNGDGISPVSSVASAVRTTAAKAALAALAIALIGSEGTQAETVRCEEEAVMPDPIDPDANKLASVYCLLIENYYEGSAVDIVNELPVPAASYGEPGRTGSTIFTTAQIIATAAVLEPERDARFSHRIVLRLRDRKTGHTTSAEGQIPDISLGPFYLDLHLEALNRGTRVNYILSCKAETETRYY